MRPDSFTQPRQLWLCVAPKAAAADMLALSGYLALGRGARVLDGGDRFNAYRAAHTARLFTADLHTALARVRVARAFTCYQMLTLCRQTPLGDKAYLIIDLLATFEDENVPPQERLRLLRVCIQHFQRWRRGAVVVVSLAPPKADSQLWEEMAGLLRRAASGTLEENFMGKTLPTINQIIQESESILKRFWRVLQPEEKELLQNLFVSAKKHVAAISEANHLLPFEVVQQAMLLEQAKEILALKTQLDSLKRRLDG